MQWETAWMFSFPPIETKQAFYIIFILSHRSSHPFYDSDSDIFSGNKFFKPKLV